MNFNQIILIGNLTRDPELRYLQNGTAVCEFGFATNRRYKRNDGENVEEVCFVDIVVWGRQGENCNEYLKKGAPAFIQGRLSFDSWQTPDGQKRSKHRVVADRVQFFPRPGGGGGGGGRGDSGAAGGSSGGGDYQQYEAPGEVGGDPSVPF